MTAGLPDRSQRGAYSVIRWCASTDAQRSSKATPQRGDNRFVRVSRDEALICLYQELSGAKTYGPSALLTASGWQFTGMFITPGMLARAIALHGNSAARKLFDRRGAGDRRVVVAQWKCTSSKTSCTSGFTEQQNDWCYGVLIW